MGAWTGGNLSLPRQKLTLGMQPLDPSQTLQALGKQSRGDPPWMWVLEGQGCPTRWAWVGTADGTSLEESTWKSILQVLPWHTRGVAALTLASFAPS